MTRKRTFLLRDGLLFDSSGDGYPIPLSSLDLPWSAMNPAAWADPRPPPMSEAAKVEALLLSGGQVDAVAARYALEPGVYRRAILAALESEKPNLSLNYVQAAVRFGFPEVLPALKRRLDRATASVDDSLSEAFGISVYAHAILSFDPTTPGTGAAFRLALTHSRVDVRAFSIARAAELDSLPWKTDELDAVFESCGSAVDDDDVVFLAALRVLLRVCEQKSKSRLVETLRKSPDVDETVFGTLTKLTGPQAYWLAGVVRELQTTQDPESMKLSMRLSPGLFDQSAVLRAAQRALAHESPVERRVGIELLRNIDLSDRDMEIRRALSDEPDEHLRRALAALSI